MMPDPVLSLGLSLVGGYGLVAQSVARRKFEMGLRMALGASISNILRLAVSFGLVPVLRGVLIGRVAALLLAPLLKGLLFDLSASDPTTFAFVVLALSGAGVATAIFLARRATRIEPWEALRAL